MIKKCVFRCFFCMREREKESDNTPIKLATKSVDDAILPNFQLHSTVFYSHHIFLLSLKDYVCFDRYACIFHNYHN